MKTIQPMVWMMQETKLKPNEKISCASLNNFQVFYLNRQTSQGGGIALGVNKDYDSTLIKEGNDETEAIAVKIFLKEMEVRTVCAYGPQETASKDKKDKFWEFLEEEVISAELEEDGLIIQMDGNLHAGSSVVKNDPNKQNNNGRLFCEFLERHSELIVVNALDICEGLITRKRVLSSRTEEAVLDFYIINEKMMPFLKKMEVDETKKYNLLNLAQCKKNSRITETDHNGLLLDMDLNVEKKKPERVEVFDFKNKACQEAFLEETDKNQELVDCFEGDEQPLVSQAAKWKKSFDNILHKCFRKIRITKRKD